MDADNGGSGALVPADFHRTINGLRVGEVYTSADLYSRYSDVAREAGRTPAHIVAFGQMMAREGHRQVTRRIGGPGRGRTGGKGRQVSAWQLT